MTNVVSAKHPVVASNGELGVREYLSTPLCVWHTVQRNVTYSGHGHLKSGLFFQRDDLLHKSQLDMTILLHEKSHVETNGQIDDQYV